uniref:Odorant-binding protein 21 n=1 Tax=Monochamus alternatus TaxID=192382 RepID=A0A1I9HZM4_MONAT|nr:odorant-binding protein 21 [Monochamus alternatus]
MKIVFVISVVLALATAHAEIDKHSQECSEETGLSESEVSEFLLGDDAENEAKATKFIMCMFKKYGALNDEGQLDIAKAQEAVKHYMKEIDAAEDQQAIDCVKEHDTTEETVLALAKCVEKRKSELSSSK